MRDFGKEKIKFSLFVHDINIYIANAKESKKELLKLIVCCQYHNIQSIFKNHMYF